MVRSEDKETIKFPIYPSFYETFFMVQRVKASIKCFVIFTMTLHTHTNARRVISLSHPYIPPTAEAIHSVSNILHIHTPMSLSLFKYDTRSIKIIVLFFSIFLSYTFVTKNQSSYRLHTQPSYHTYLGRYLTHT